MTVSRSVPANRETETTEALRTIAAADIETCLSKNNTSVDGLSNDAVSALKSKYGPNEIRTEKAPPWHRQLIRAFVNPFSGILLMIVAVTIAVNVFFTKPEDQDYKTVFVVVTIILLSSLLRFFQEYASNNAAAKLRAMIQTNATVLRQGTGMAEVPLSDLVPGDIVILSAGDMIPADCRLIHAKDLFLSESMLTGEPMPVEKHEQPVTDAAKKNIFELGNICFMGTNVLSGSARAVVLMTGNRAFLGSLSNELTSERKETSFDKGINSVSWLLIKFMMVMVPLVFIANVATKGDWLDALLFSVAIAVGLTPEMLPMIVTANLSRGAIRMSKHRVIVKQINSIQNFGAMDVLCTDKTGTLTMDQIALEKYLDANGIEDKEVLKWAYLNSYYQTGLKNLMDVAVLEHKEWEDKLDVANEYKKTDEIPFDFQRRRMSVVLGRPDGRQVLITKGAVEEMLDLCKFVALPEEGHNGFDNCKPTVLEGEQKQKILALAESMNSEGLRVLLIALRVDHDREAPYTVADEADMVLAGFIGFLDPPKPSAKPAINALEQLGIKVKVLTGDNVVVTRKICQEVDIPVATVLSGMEIEGMDDAALAIAVEQTEVFAKLTPSQKSRIIQALQGNGHCVGYIGDGINDATALKDADVGISVEKAVDIAKESAGIILLEKDLMVLATGVRYGRQTFGNIIKYIKMTASSNFGNMFSMLGASLLLPFLPMMPIQLLFQNLLYDFSQSTIPWDTMDEDYLKVPRKWEAKGLARFMVVLGPISSIFDYATFAVLYYVFRANNHNGEQLFQTGWFVEGLLSQTLIVHMIRTRKIPFLQSRATAPVIIATLLIMVVGLYLPYSPVAQAMHFKPLPPAYFPWLVGILLAYSLLTQGVKWLFIRYFGDWL